MEQSVHGEYRRLSEHWWFRARRRIFAHLLAHGVVPLPRGGRARILDVGPGSGVNLPLLARHGDVTVLDSDRGSLRACRDQGAAAVVLGDAGRPPLGEAAFDLITALDVVEHLDDDAAALRAMRALLRPGGALLLTVPALRCLWGRQDVLSGHRRRYRRGELVQRVHAAGFTVRRASYFNALLLPPILAVRLAMRPFLAGSVRRGRSDLSLRAPLGLDRVLAAALAAERHWLRHRNLPLGVSLLVVAVAGPDGNGAAAPTGR